MKKLIPPVLLALLLMLGVGAWWIVQDPGATDATPETEVAENTTQAPDGEDDGNRKRSRVTGAATEVEPEAESEAVRPDEAPPPAPPGIEVLVVDAAGRPCGDVDVHLQESHVDGAWTSSLHATHSETGIASIPVVAPEDAPEKSVATLALPFEPRVTAPVDPTRPNDTPYRLELPPSGRVVVEVVDVEGREIIDTPFAALRLERHDDGVLPIRDREDPVDTFVDAETGEAVFPHVGLGLTLVAIVPGRSDDERSARITFEGPVEAGAEVRVRAVLGHPRPVLTGRLVTPDGEPVADAEIFGDVLPEHGDMWRYRHDGWATTDESGLFRLALDVAPERARGRMLRLGRRVTTSKGRTERSEIVTRELPPGYGTAEIDLGDLVSAAGMLLVSGVVLDPAGKPLENVKLTPLQMTKNGPRRIGDAPDAITDASGRFELRGPPPVWPVSVAVLAANLRLADPPVVEVGTTGVQVRLETAGGLAGSLLPVPGLDLGSLRLFVHGEVTQNGEYVVSERLGIGVEEDGSFTRHSLSPGMGRFTVQTGWGEQTTILSIDDVRIVAGEITRDPRLQSIDLSKVVRPIRLTIRDADGARIPHAAAHHRPAESTSEDDRVWTDVDQTDEGEVAILSSAPQSEVVVLAPGYRSVTRTLSGGEHEIRLEPAKMTEIQIVLPRDRPFPKTPHYVSLELEYVGPPGSTTVDDDDDWWGDPRSIDLWEARFDADRQVTVKAWEPGRYELKLLIWASSVDSASGEYVKTDPEHAIVEIGTDGRKARLEVAFDAEDYARIMRDE